MKKFKYSCGCSFDLEEKDNKKYITFNPDINKISLECEKTWDLISSGNTKGIFQLESRLGRSIAKKLKPQNIEQLSALISILRPGSLEAYRDGKSVTQHYIDRKNGLESIDYFHPSLKPILEKSLGELIYQEQAMQIATDIAGFSLQESDELRKAIGKKLADKMAQVKKKFLEGSEQLKIVNKSEAEEIFGWIEKSQRYSFNKSILDDTVVISESGEKTIRELNIGEKILAPTILGNEYVEVVNKYDHGEQEVFEITLDNGYQITCTMEHKFLCSDNKIYPLSEILLNSYLIVCLNGTSNSLVKIEKIGIKPTVDIEVKSNEHLFFGNGMATSNSHAVSYAMNAYLSAYTKAHFPKIFFASYLKFAKDKIDPQDEIKALVQNANEMDIIIHTPDLRILNKNFILKDNKIYFGLTDIKGFGESIYNKMLALIKDKNINLQACDWLDLLLKILLNINSIGAKALIESGALSFINKSRNSMLFDLSIASKLTSKELNYIEQSITVKFKNLKDGLKYVLNYGKINKNRKKIIEDLLSLIDNPPYSLEDTPEWIADSEDRALGCSITCSKIDMYDISMTNTTCRDFKNGHKKDNIIIGGEIDYINVTKTKTGKNKGSEMCFVNLLDQTGSMDNVIFFPEQYKKYKNLLFNGNIVILVGNRSKSGDGLIVEKAYIAKT